MSVVVDEAHCVSHWGASFRKKYGTLGVIRAFLAKDTPVIAVTATLTARVRRDLHNVLHIPKGSSRFINIGNDRSNVAIVVRACQHPQNTYLDTNFIIPSRPVSPSDIPKTYIYVDNIATGNEIVEHLTSLLEQRNPSLPASKLIRPFNATMSHEYRQDAMAAFRANPAADWQAAETSPAQEPAEAYIRILVCTDAAGMVSRPPCASTTLGLIFNLNRDATFRTLILSFNGNSPKHFLTGFNVRDVPRARAVGQVSQFCWLNARHTRSISAHQQLPRGSLFPKLPAARVSLRLVLALVQRSPLPFPKSTLRPMASIVEERPR